MPAGRARGVDPIEEPTGNAFSNGLRGWEAAHRRYGHGLTERLEDEARGAHDPFPPAELRTLDSYAVAKIIPGVRAKARARRFQQQIARRRDTSAHDNRIRREQGRQRRESQPQPARGFRERLE